MKRLFITVLMGWSVVSCTTLLGQTARSSLDRFCRADDPSLLAILLVPAQVAAARVLCSAINDKLGTPPIEEESTHESD